MKFCPNCGNKYARDEKFCSECGAKREPGSSVFLGRGMMGLDSMLYSAKEFEPIKDYVITVYRM